MSSHEPLPGKKIFVHCRLGDDRTGMMIAAYRMGQQHWTAKEAMQEMDEFGYRGVHHLLCPGLGRYEKSFPQRLQHDPVFANLRLSRKYTANDWRQLLSIFKPSSVAISDTRS